MHALSLTPYPNNLIPFQPVDGPDTQFSQLYRPIGKHPFKEAGIKGFARPAPFHVLASFINVGDFKDFHWPLLSELKDKIDPFPWSSDNEWVCYFAKEPPLITPLMYNGPPPSSLVAPPLVSHDALSITDLAPLIIASKDKLFFILHEVSPGCREWCLVHVTLKGSLFLYCACLQNVCFLVEFYVGHPADVPYNAINEQFWFQYCNWNAPMFGMMDAQLITPLDSSENRALHDHLVPVCAWINLTHGDTFIYGAPLTLQRFRIVKHVI
jgi:hypothetical protein